MQKKLAIINVNSAASKALKKWDKIFSEIEKTIGDIEVYKSDSVQESERVISQAILSGTRHFISAGGDGAVNFLLNAILKNKHKIPLEDFTLGAVGLGSSNDFHKPFSKKIGKIPVRLDFTLSSYRDIARVEYQNEKGQSYIHYFIVSSSAGIVAAANKNFNRNMGALNFLKRTSTDLAILYAFFYTLYKYKNIPIGLSMNNAPFQEYRVSYLAVSKTRHISGMFHFEDVIKPDDGLLLVKLLHQYSKAGLIWAMLKFSKGKESGLTHLETDLPEKVSLESPEPFTLEMDGETVECCRATIQIFREKIHVCG